MKMVIVFFAVVFSVRAYAQFDVCEENLKWYLTKYDAIVFVKSPFCSGCLYDVRNYFDSLGLKPRNILALFEKNASAANMVQIEEMLETKLQIKAKNIEAIEPLECIVRSGIYVSEFKSGNLTWITFP